MTKAAERLLARMVELVQTPESGWAPVPGTAGSTVRLTRTHETPSYHRGTGFGRWPEPTYESHTFVTLVAGKVILGVAAAPWMGRNDHFIPFWLAEAILADPNDLGQDYPRQWRLKAERKRPRS